MGKKKFKKIKGINIFNDEFLTSENQLGSIDAFEQLANGVITLEQYMSGEYDANPTAGKPVKYNGLLSKAIIESGYEQAVSVNVGSVVATDEEEPETDNVPSAEDAFRMIASLTGLGNPLGSVDAFTTLMGQNYDSENNPKVEALNESDVSDEAFEEDATIDVEDFIDIGNEEDDDDEDNELENIKFEFNADFQTLNIKDGTFDTVVFLQEGDGMGRTLAPLPEKYASVNEDNYASNGAVLSLYLGIVCSKIPMVICDTDAFNDAFMTIEKIPADYTILKLEDHILVYKCMGITDLYDYLEDIHDQLACANLNLKLFIHHLIHMNEVCAQQKFSLQYYFNHDAQKQWLYNVENGTCVSIYDFIESLDEQGLIEYTGHKNNNVSVYKRLGVLDASSIIKFNNSEMM